MNVCDSEFRRNVVRWADKTMPELRAAWLKLVGDTRANQRLASRSTRGELMLMLFDQADLAAKMEAKEPNDAQPPG